MIVSSTSKAFEIAYGMIGEYELDEESSKNAGYNIWRATADSREYLSDLGNRLEVNTKDGKSLNIWIDNKPKKIKELETKVSEQELEIIKLKAKLYDLLCC